jgi:hypothetical protein
MQAMLGKRAAIRKAISDDVVQEQIESLRSAIMVKKLESKVSTAFDKPAIAFFSVNYTLRS